ncbi:MAG: hypothetical protein DWQ10_02340 [Calditrichaeota bacterium]|nr:MAG: hypothetical protein DWQ10_02340 [Calditrichota bacterium]
MKKQFLTLFLLLLPIGAFSQGLNVHPRYLVNMPIASTLPRASFDVSMYSFAHGGLLAGLEVGMTERFMFGVTFGGINVIGENEVDWHPFAGASARFQLVRETYNLPSVSFGFNSQGQGRYLADYKRFERKSTGFFTVVSKVYEVFDHLSCTVGMNYSLENQDKDDDLNLFSGIELGVSTDLALMLEYDFALNDNSEELSNVFDDGGNPISGRGEGYLNFGVRYRIKNAVYFEANLIDLTENKFQGTRRSVKITYFEFF